MIQAVGYRMPGIRTPINKSRFTQTSPFAPANGAQIQFGLKYIFSNRAFAADRVYLPDCGGAVCAAVVCNGMLVLSMSWVNFQDPSA